MKILLNFDTIKITKVSDYFFFKFSIRVVAMRTLRSQHLQVGHFESDRRRIRAGYSPNSFFEAKVGA